jgi:hypothetical protein
VTVTVVPAPDTPGWPFAANTGVLLIVVVPEGNTASKTTCTVTLTV